MSVFRCYSLLDRLCLGIDHALRTLSGNAKTTGQPYPAKNIEAPLLNEVDRQQAAALMRINHAGEICAQALYHGQAIVSQAPDVQEKMQQAAKEEGDHLVWCQQRIEELGSHVSYLNPLWYLGSFCIGMVAGMVGDKWSLGFVAETETQVLQHLQGHLSLLPIEDKRSTCILQQMQRDEARHRDEALNLGAVALPGIIKAIMRMTSKVMVKTTYWI